MEPSLHNEPEAAGASQLDRELELLFAAINYGNDRISVVRARLERIMIQIPQGLPRDTIEEVTQGTHLSNQIQKMRTLQEDTNRIIDYVLSNLDL